MATVGLYSKVVYASAAEVSQVDIVQNPEEKPSEFVGELFLTLLT